MHTSRATPILVRASLRIALLLPLSFPAFAEVPATIAEVRQLVTSYQTEQSVIDTKLARARNEISYANSQIALFTASQAPPDLVEFRATIAANRKLSSLEAAARLESALITPTKTRLQAGIEAGKVVLDLTKKKNAADEKFSDAIGDLLLEAAEYDEPLLKILTGVLKDPAPAGQSWKRNPWPLESVEGGTLFDYADAKGQRQLSVDIRLDSPPDPGPLTSPFDKTLLRVPSGSLRSIRVFVGRFRVTVTIHTRLPEEISDADLIAALRASVDLKALAAVDTSPESTVGKLLPLIRKHRQLRNEEDKARGEIPDQLAVAKARFETLKRPADYTPEEIAKFRKDAKNSYEVWMFEEAQYMAAIESSVANTPALRAKQLAEARKALDEHTAKQSRLIDEQIALRDKYNRNPKADAFRDTLRPALKPAAGKLAGLEPRFHTTLHDGTLRASYSPKGKFNTVASIAIQIARPEHDAMDEPALLRSVAFAGSGHATATRVGAYIIAIHFRDTPLPDSEKRATLESTFDFKFLESISR